MNIRKRRKCKEFNPNRIKDDVLIRCPECDSTNVELKGWVNPNTKVPSFEPEYNIDSEEPLFCNNCSKCIELDDDIDYRENIELLLGLTQEELIELNKKFNN